MASRVEGTVVENVEVWDLFSGGNNAYFATRPASNTWWARWSRPDNYPELQFILDFHCLASSHSIASLFFKKWLFVCAICLLPFSLSNAACSSAKINVACATTASGPRPSQQDHQELFDSEDERCQWPNHLRAQARHTLPTTRSCLKLVCILNSRIVTWTRNRGKFVHTIGAGCYNSTAFVHIGQNKPTSCIASRTKHVHPVVYKYLSCPFPDSPHWLISDGHRSTRPP